MEYCMRGKWIFESAKTKSELINCLRDRIEFIKALPDDIEIENANDGQDDYVILRAEPKDKDDSKYLKRLGFRRVDSRGLFA